MEISVRELKTFELEKCAEVIRSSFIKEAEELSLSQNTYPLYPAFISADRLNFESGNGVRPVGLFADGEQIGFAGLDLREREVILTRPCVLPEYRGNGYGKILVKTAKQMASDAGYAKISVLIPEGRPTLQNWFAELGFSDPQTKRVPDYPFAVVRLEG